MLDMVPSKPLRKFVSIPRFVAYFKSLLRINTLSKINWMKSTRKIKLAPFKWGIFVRMRIIAASGSHIKSSHGDSFRRI